VTVDEAMFLGGLAKKDFLKEFQPDFFFDDQLGHCELASDVAPTGQVLSGIANQIKK
ncbi:MAG: 5'-nucleotidase, partial [Polynucleobacter victoriensis]|jgi:5'-nucleotidase